MKRNFFYVGGVLCTIICIVAFGLLVEEKEGFTRIYFNAETDLPDSVIHLKNEMIHELEVNRTYYINFTIASFEKKPVTYTYVVEYEMFTLTEQVTLFPGEIMPISLKFIPNESMKWTLDSTTVENWENVIDITKDSWIAGKGKIEIILGQEGLPTIIKEDYHMPISSNVNQFGKILHSNVSIDELEAKPFTKHYSTIHDENLKKEYTTNSINLSVKGNKLYLYAESRNTLYISEEQLFQIILFDSLYSEWIQFDPGDYNGKIQEIYFRYRVK